MSNQEAVVGQTVDDTIRQGFYCDHGSHFGGPLVPAVSYVHVEGLIDCGTFNIGPEGLKLIRPPDGKKPDQYHMAACAEHIGPFSDSLCDCAVPGKWPREVAAEASRPLAEAEHKAEASEAEEESVIQETPGKFNPNGPGAIGFNACATCGTDVDWWGVDRDNRKHFDGGCAGFAQAERIKALLATLNDDTVLMKFLEAMGKRKYPTQIEALVETISVYKKLAETLIYIAEHEPRVVQAKQQVDGYRQRLQTLFKSAGGFGRDTGFDNDWSFQNRLQSVTQSF